MVRVMPFSWECRHGLDMVEDHEYAELQRQLDLHYSGVNGIDVNGAIDVEFEVVSGEDGVGVYGDERNRSLQRTD
jgi:hypothetical protein